MNTSYQFKDFISDLELITSVGSTDEDKIRKIQRKMKLLISSGDFYSALNERAKTPNTAHYARYLLHQDANGRFVVVSIVWGAGQGTPIHDHTIWGVAGILKGELHIVNYDRLDDGQRPRHADLRETSSMLAPAGTVLYVLPPNDEIHLLENNTDQVTITLHVYGKQLTDCNQYKLEDCSCLPWQLNYEPVDVR